MARRRVRESSSSTAASWAAAPPGAASARSATASSSRSWSGRDSRRTRPSTTSTSRSTPSLVAEAVGDGAHLVGHSYGGVIALLAAAAVPDARPLADRDRAAGDGRRPGEPRRRRVHREGGIEWWQTGPTDDPEAFLRGFLDLRRLRLRPPLPAAAAARAGSADADRRAQPLGGGDPPRRPRRGRGSRSSSSPAPTTPRSTPSATCSSSGSARSGSCCRATATRRSGIRTSTRGWRSSWRGPRPGRPAEAVAVRPTR